MDDVVTPDDKNWTWVLERRCGDCGFEAASFDAAIAGMAIRDLAVRWVAVLTGDGIAERPRSGVWSPLEYGCHVRDVFRRFDHRLKLMLERDEPNFENWDQDRTAIEDRYAEQHPADVSAQLVAAAASLASRFDGVAGPQWARTGIRSDGTVFTVRTLAKYLMHDPVHHLWDVGAPVPALDARSHRTMAIEANNSVWDILGSAAGGLSGDEADEMTRRAHAAAYHWQRAVGAGPANQARASWLLSRVWAVRNESRLALQSARRCLATCEEHGLADFDLAYAHEALARSYACSGDEPMARRHIATAREVPIADPDDRSVFDGDLAAEPWFGLRE
ncbi:MAG: DinB family protein [Ilumatobacteraceae bacterium]